MCLFCLFICLFRHKGCIVFTFMATWYILSSKKLILLPLFFFKIDMTDDLDLMFYVSFEISFVY